MKSLKKQFLNSNNKSKTINQNQTLAALMIISSIKGTKATIQLSEKRVKYLIIEWIWSKRKVSKNKLQTSNFYKEIKKKLLTNLHKIMAYCKLQMITLIIILNNLLAIIIWLMKRIKPRQKHRHRIKDYR